MYMNSKAIRSAIMLAIIAFIIMYLQKMEICECVDSTLVKRMEYTEMAIAGLISLSLIGNLATGGKFRMIPENRFVSAGYMAVIFAIFGYLAFLVYNYSMDATGCK